MAKQRVLLYRPFERLGVPRPVNKVRWVKDQCRGKFVVDLGAYDETAVTLKQGTEYWLHGSIVSVAERVLGIDNSPRLPAEGQQTGEQGLIIRGDVCDVRSIPLDRRPDVVVAGELIEHLPDPLAFLRQLGADDRFRGSELVITTPNACSLHNVILGVFGRESTHRDHLAIHSFKTLSTLMREASLARYEILPYHVRLSESALQARGVKWAAIWLLERVVNALEAAFPLLSGGWIVKVSL